MKNILLIAVIVAALGAVALLGAQKVNAPQSAPDDAPAEEKTANNTAYGFTFAYPPSYTVVTQEDAPRGDLVFAQSVFDTHEYTELIESMVPREAPVSLSIEVFRNPLHISPQEWIRQNERSNYALSQDGQIAEVRIGGTTFAAYQYDGLYRADAYVYGQEGYIYVFSNMWDDVQSPMKSDMEKLLETVLWSEPLLPAQSAHGDIIVSSPEAADAIASPLRVEGVARGGWFFEASFPLVLVNWDGLIIAEGFATAEGEWMTDDYVPFSGEIVFTKPDFDARGTLILKKDNPSGLPENDDAIEIPVVFE